MFEKLRDFLGFPPKEKTAKPAYTPPENRVKIEGEETMDPLMAEAIRQCWETGETTIATRDERGETIERIGEE